MTDKPKQTKKSQPIGMLSKKGGAKVEQISKKLGWQPHTVRAALTGNIPTISPDRDFW